MIILNSAKDTVAEKVFRELVSLAFHLGVSTITIDGTKPSGPIGYFGLSENSDDNILNNLGLYVSNCLTLNTGVLDVSLPGLAGSSIDPSPYFKYPDVTKGCLNVSIAAMSLEYIDTIDVFKMIQRAWSYRTDSGAQAIRSLGMLNAGALNENSDPWDMILYIGNAAKAIVPSNLDSDTNRSTSLLSALQQLTWKVAQCVRPAIEAASPSTSVSYGLMDDAPAWIWKFHNAATNNGKKGLFPTSTHRALQHGEGIGLSDSDLWSIIMSILVRLDRLEASIGLDSITESIPSAKGATSLIEQIIVLQTDKDASATNGKLNSIISSISDGSAAIGNLQSELVALWRASMSDGNKIGQLANIGDDIQNVKDDVSKLKKQIIASSGGSLISLLTK